MHANDPPISTSINILQHTHVYHSIPVDVILRKLKEYAVAASLVCGHVRLYQALSKSEYNDKIEVLHRLQRKYLIGNAFSIAYAFFKK